MKLRKVIDRLSKGISELIQPKYKFKFVGDIPRRAHRQTVYIVQDGTEPDALVFKCPCGCKTTINLNLLRDARPCWSYSIREKLISITPSIRAMRGCKSHFWLTDGKIHWCGRDGRR
jgi:hypothetical protein